MTYTCKQHLLLLRSVTPTRTRRSGTHVQNATLPSLPPTPPFETQQETRSDLLPKKLPLPCNEARLDTWQQAAALQAAHARRSICRRRCRRPRSSRTAQPKRPNDTIRYDITRAYKQASSSKQHSTAYHSAVCRLPLSAMVHLSLDLGHLRFKVKPNLRVLPANPYMRRSIITLLHSLTVGCRVGCGVCCAREDAGAAMGFNALADLAATCVAAGCGRSGGSCWAAARIYACMQDGWLGDGRLARLVGRSVGLFRFCHPTSCCGVAVRLPSDGERAKRFWKKMSRHGALVARFCGCHA